MMKKISLALVVLLLSNALQSQSLFQKKADKLYDELSYIAAVDFYKSLVKTDKPSEFNMRRLAECNFKVYDFKNAETAYKNLYEKFPSTTTESDLINYLQCLKYNEKYDEAKNVLSLIEQKSKDNIIFKNHSKKQNYYNELKEDSSSYKVTNVESLNTEESEFSPVFFNRNKAVMFSSNRRNTAARNKKFAWDDSYFIDVYTSEKKDSLKFESTMSMEKTISSTYHDGPACLSGDEKTVYLTKSNIVTKTVKGALVNVVNLKLYILKKDSLGRLSKPESFPYNSDNYSLGHATVTKDGTKMYFVSDMPGGWGQTDLYVSNFENGAWQQPENLGQAINTEGREMFPYVHEDGTLFFSTDGRAGLGGLDLYFTVPSMDAYFEPQSLGYPMNSNFDDFGFALNDDLQTGYFSSNRVGGKGKDDIYYFRSKEPLMNVTVSGLVFDESSKEPITNATVYLLDKDKIVIDSAKVNDKGEYSFTLKDPSKEYFIGARERTKYYDRLIPLGKTEVGPNKKDIGLFPKYKMASTVIDSKTNAPIKDVKVSFAELGAKDKKTYLTDSTGKISDVIRGKKPGDRIQFSMKYEKEGYITVEKKYDMVLDVNTIIELTQRVQKMELGADIAKVIDTNPIFFDLGKWNIRKDAAAELDKVVAVMLENPKMTIELGSHSDCRGSAQANLILSDKRAKSSAAYIISKGISKDRITGKGYGESKPINKCECEGKKVVPCTEDEHQANRRTEFLITKF
jgi:outer membrane protein OmpA-like peptidoglycan-associated protein